MRFHWIAWSFIGLLACSSGGGSGTGSGGSNGSGGGTQGSGGAGGGAATGGGGSSTGGGHAGDTWNDYAMNFFATYCVECHNPSDPARDYNKLADVMADAPLIRCGVAPMTESGCGASPAPKQFPIGTGPKPSDAERARIVAWIDAGLP